MVAILDNWMKLPRAARVTIFFTIGLRPVVTSPLQRLTHRFGKVKLAWPKW